MALISQNILDLVQSFVDTYRATIQRLFQKPEIESSESDQDEESSESTSVQYAEHHLGSGLDEFLRALHPKVPKHRRSFLKNFAYQQMRKAYLEVQLAQEPGPDEAKRVKLQKELLEARREYWREAIFYYDAKIADYTLDQKAEILKLGAEIHAIFNETMEGQDEKTIEQARVGLDDACLRYTIITCETALQNIGQMKVDDVDNLRRRLAAAYSKLATRAGTYTDVSHFDILTYQSTLHLKGIEQLRLLTQASALSRQATKFLVESAEEFYVVSQYYHGVGYGKPTKQVEWIGEAIHLMDEVIRRTQDPVDLARYFLRKSEFHYLKAIVYRDEKFPTTIMTRELAAEEFDKAKQCRDYAFAQRTKPAESPKQRSIVTLVRNSDRSHELLKTNIPLQKPIAQVENLIEEKADLFLNQARKNESFHRFLKSCHRGFHPKDCMVALYDMHLEANRAMENQDTYESMGKFELFMGSELYELDTEKLKLLHDQLTSGPVVNLVNGLLFCFRYYDRLNRQFDSGALETGFANVTGNLRKMLMSTVKQVELVLAARGIKVAAKKSYLTEEDVTSEEMIYTFSNTNAKAVDEVVDAVNKGKIAMMPMEATHRRSYREMVHAITGFYFDAKQMNRAILAMYDQLGVVQRVALSELKAKVLSYAKDRSKTITTIASECIALVRKGGLPQAQLLSAMKACFPAADDLAKLDHDLCIPSEVAEPCQQVQAQFRQDVLDKVTELSDEPERLIRALQELSKAAVVTLNETHKRVLVPLYEAQNKFHQTGKEQLDHYKQAVSWLASHCLLAKQRGFVQESLKFSIRLTPNPELSSLAERLGSKTIREYFQDIHIARESKVKFAHTQETDNFILVDETLEFYCACIRDEFRTRKIDVKTLKLSRRELGFEASVEKGRSVK